jgi:predicted metal-dependent hydrolase
MAVQTLQLGNIAVDIVQKDIRNIHLSVYPPHGTVRISAPLRTNPETLRIFAISKLDWIRQQQQKLQAQAREAPREYLPRESHYLWGQRYLLDVIEKDTTPNVELKHNTIRLQIRPAADPIHKQMVLNAFYRQQLKAAIPPLVTKWEQLIGVNLEGFIIRQMKTKWGSCSPELKTIRLNLELAKKPPICLEYVIVHEMTHLLEPTHNHRFVDLMDQFFPRWKSCRDDLNRLPTNYKSTGAPSGAKR